MKKIKALVPHVEDWDIKIPAIGHIVNNIFIGEYKYRGMVYGIEINVKEIIILN